ncbi:MAG TPA: hypothetical protein VGX46_11985, partial [Vicinamibacterales bacterium]|nr:hypothetical protein [Vicinamibacterales bacterium]
MLVALGLAVAQALAGVRIATVTQLTEPLAYANPSLNVKGTVTPAPGHRLDIVVIALGSTPLEAEVGAFTLTAVGGLAYAPIG